MHIRSLLLVALLLFLLPGLACNFPTSAVQPTLSGEELRQTLAAYQSNPPTPSQTPPSEQPQPSPLPVQATTQAGASETIEPTPAPTTPIPEIFQIPLPLPTIPGPYYIYTTSTNDTLPAIAGRFDVKPESIIATAPLSEEGFLPPGLALAVPVMFEQTTPPKAALPDSEMIYSPSAASFDVDGFVQQADGYLSTYQESVQSVTLSGAAIIQRAAVELSVNPRLLLAFLEYRAGWVFGQPAPGSDLRHPIGFEITDRSGLYQEILITGTQLNVAYYGWRQGSFPRLTFPDQTTLRLYPGLNAGTAALQHLMAIFYSPANWEKALYGSEGLLERYQEMFGNPWERAATVEPLFPQGLTQPEMILPFLPGMPWALTAGPHDAWNAGTPRGALDFAPITGEPACAVSTAWASAVADGVIARATENAVALDLDGDGSEQTGWVVVYFHLADSGLVAEGSQVAADDLLGHPSCQGGRATGTHVHISRKFNGEWLPADGPLPWVLSGWEAYAGDSNYRGGLTKDGQIITADPGGGGGSTIER
ncbi:MAG: M23 family metallopeptidase [Anaerolineales bacterium]|nr:M23 family metallopeptidase [Anaerolineales bacterium]